MADSSFTLPGGQKIPKKTLLIGGAVLVVVLVVLMRRGQSAEPGEEGQFGAQGDLGEGEGAGGFGGASDADLGSILAALSQMNQAPSQIYSPAPASIPTLTGGGVQWSAAMLSDPSQEEIGEEVTGLRGIDVFGPEGRPIIGQQDTFVQTSTPVAESYPSSVGRVGSYATAGAASGRVGIFGRPSTAPAISGRAGVGIQYSNPVVSPSSSREISGRAGVGRITRNVVKVAQPTSASKAKAIKAQIRKPTTVFVRKH